MLDCCFVVTEWDIFRRIPSSLFKEAMARPVVIDGRRALDPSKLDQGIIYRAIGLGNCKLAGPRRVGLAG